MEEVGKGELNHRKRSQLHKQECVTGHLRHVKAMLPCLIRSLDEAVVPPNCKTKYSSNR